jgi:hypothetical protein
VVIFYISQPQFVHNFGKGTVYLSNSADLRDNFIKRIAAHEFLLLDLKRRRIFSQVDVSEIKIEHCLNLLKVSEHVKTTLHDNFEKLIAASEFWSYFNGQARYV